MKPKPTREDIMKQVSEERHEFSDRMNNEVKYSEVYDLTTVEGRDKFMLDYIQPPLIQPMPLTPVLAKITLIGELGNSEWYEVVFHDGIEWCSYAGSDTFDDGEKVLNWKYCTDIL